MSYQAEPTGAKLFDQMVSQPSQCNIERLIDPSLHIRLKGLMASNNKNASISSSNHLSTGPCPLANRFDTNQKMSPRSGVPGFNYTSSSLGTYEQQKGSSRDSDQQKQSHSCSNAGDYRPTDFAQRADKDEPGTHDHDAQNSPSPY